ncbi:MAG: hypothetical protein J6X85_07890 [Ruminococcus sp.]|nr:hypothetical protein [Ruminococcus sp.]
MVKRPERKDFISDLIVFLIYTAGIITVTAFHELGFDECQAWLIAKSAPYKDILTYIPHYEGHPPLWHLILSVFAKNGAPPDLTLKAVNTVFSAGAMALLIFRSPFPKIVRRLLPFNFYFFYQYGVLSRPYSLAMLVFFLLAITYKDRNTQPWRYILSMALLCLVSAYGIMLAGGLCIAWTIEIISELVRNRKLKLFWQDKRFYSLCFILVTAAVLIMLIIPADDCYYTGIEDKTPFLKRLTVLANYKRLAEMPFDSWSGLLVGNYAVESNTMLEIAEILCGTAMWALISAVAVKNRKFLTFFLPYIFMTGFMAFKYVFIHHLGMGTLFHVFIFWIMAEQEGGIAIPDFLKKLNKKISSPLIRKTAIGAGALVCLAPIAYSGIASVSDITKNYGLGCIADIIRDNHLENTNIMALWKVEYEADETGEKNDPYIFKVLEIPSEHMPVKENYTYLMGAAAMIQTYFDENIFMNYNADCPDDLYMHYKYKEDTEAVFAKWREKGLPDFIVGYCPVDEVYDEQTLEGVRYLPVKLIEHHTFYKVISEEGITRFYIREDLMDDYPQFEWADDQTGNVFERKDS